MRIKHPLSTEQGKRKIDYLLIHEDDESNEEETKIRNKFELLIKEEGLELDRQDVQRKDDACLWSITKKEVQHGMISLRFIKKCFILLCSLIIKI